MSTENDELKDRVANLGKEFETSQRHPDGFQDVSGEYPRTPYFYGPSTNEAARGVKRNELYIGGGNVDMDLGLETPVTSLYPYNQVDESRSGHVIEVDDTPAGERILIRHRTGAGVEVRPDGSVIVATRNNLVHIVHGDNKVIVEGDAHLAYNGNLDIDVSGDMNVKVGGNYNVQVGNDLKNTVNGNRRDRVHGNSGDIVTGNRSQTTAGVVTETALSNRHVIVDGNNKEVIDGTNTIRSSGDLNISTQTTGAMSGNNLNIAAQNMSVFGDQGTIGGENIIMYNYNMYTGHSIDAGDTVTTQTFYGDLVGTATQAMKSNEAGLHPSSGSHAGAGYGYTAAEISVDATATAEPTAGILTGYLGNSTLGAPTVIVDAGNELKNEIDQTVNNGGVTNRPLTIREVRSKLRDPNAISNQTFITNQIGNGVLNAEFARSAPPTVGRVTEKAPTSFLGFKFLGQIEPAGATKKIKPRPAAKPILPDPRYNPNLQSEITPKTKLGLGVTLAKFLGGRGDKVSIDHITTLDERKKIARQFYLQAEALKAVSEDTGKFKNHRMVVLEGLYRKSPGETITAGSFNDLAQQGRVVVYQLLDQSGNVDLLKTFDLAIHLKDNLFYEKLSLSYDNYDPSGALNAELIIQMPTVTEQFIGNYTMNIETLYNNKIQANKEFIEIV